MYTMIALTLVKNHIMIALMHNMLEVLLLHSNKFCANSYALYLYPDLANDFDKRNQATLKVTTDYKDFHERGLKWFMKL